MYLTLTLTLQVWDDALAQSATEWAQCGAEWFEHSSGSNGENLAVAATWNRWTQLLWYGFCYIVSKVFIIYIQNICNDRSFKGKIHYNNYTSLSGNILYWERQKCGVIKLGQAIMN
jgi:hypothetical protein